MRSIWVDAPTGELRILDQTLLPHRLEQATLRTVEEVATAIVTMQVRGAPLIGVAAAYGISLAMEADPSDRGLEAALQRLAGTRPTAINLGWALEKMRAAIAPLSPSARAQAARRAAEKIAESEVEACQQIGRHGLAALEKLFPQRRKKERLQVLTHCNAGWLATVEWGTALAPLYLAHRAGLPLHVWVSETRPRNQGGLTAWELGQAGVPHTMVADNEAGILMQRGEVDLCLVGADRVTAQGDVCNKIGTYLKAVAARDNDVGFHAALPRSTIDWRLQSGNDIPIEERAAEELHLVRGRLRAGGEGEVRVTPEGTSAVNHAFDVTPARLVTSLFTDRGECPATREGLAALFPPTTP